MGEEATNGVVCVWLREFPAWAVARSLDTRTPIAVVHGGKVVSATRSALQSGVVIGMAGDRVVDVSSRTEVHLRDATREAAMWEYALERFHTLTPFLESPEQGVAFLRDSPVSELEALSVDFGASVGIAPSRRIAKLAAARAAAGYVLSPPKSRVAGFFKHTSVDVFSALGFDEEIAQRLTLFGYRTLNQAQTLSERHLKAQFGREVGEELYTYLNPATEKPIGSYHPPKAAEALYVFEWDEDICDETRFAAVTERLVEEAHNRLKGWCCRRLVAYLCDGRQTKTVSRILPKATNKRGYLLRQVRTLIRPELDSVSSLSTLRLELRSFSVGEARQATLWRSRPMLDDGARKVEPRFPGACLRAVHVPHALLPEDEYRYEPYVVLDEDER